MASATLETQARVNWRQVTQFLGLTFGLTWLLDLFLWRVVGFGSSTMILVLQLQMLLPAFSAMVLGLFASQNGRARLRSLRGASRLFVFFFIAFTLVYVAMIAAAMVWPELLQVFSTAATALMVVGLLMVVVFRFVRGRGALAPIGLLGAKPRYWLLFGLGLIVLAGAQTLLNYVFNLGHTVDITSMAGQAMMPPEIFLVVAIFQGIVISPFLGVLVAFGEEYGWRGYLQGELIKLGKVRGILLVGVIWGLWHAPVIAMGYNYPGYPIAGIFMMTIYTIVLGFILGYAVLKTGSVWLAAYLHALSNQALSTFFLMAYAPNDSIFSFGAGIYGAILGAIVVLVILRDPIWRGSGAGATEATAPAEV
jgi:uncharacterized protein